MSRSRRAIPLFVVGCAVAWAGTVRAGEVWRVIKGRTTLRFSDRAMRRFGLEAGSTLRRFGRKIGTTRASIVRLDIDTDTDLTLSYDAGDVYIVSGGIRHVGGVTLTGPGGKRTVKPLILVSNQNDRSLGWLKAIDERRPGMPTLLFRDTNVALDPLSGRLVMTCDAVSVSPAWAAALGQPDLWGTPIGSAELRLELVALDDGVAESAPVAESAASTSTPLAASTAGVSTASVTGGAIGPDVIVGKLPAIASWGTEDGIAVFSVGTTSCNKGDEPAMWVRDTPDHPVIAQNMYRLKDNRFEQIGMSWVKHGFTALAQNECLFGCQKPINPVTNEQDFAKLGVGCSDPYGETLNGRQDILGPRSQVDGFTGVFPYPPPIPDSGCFSCGVRDRRLQVHVADLPADIRNPGAKYFVEGHYVLADDAQAGNGANNASYAEFSFTDPLLGCVLLTTDDFCAGPTGDTMQEQPAIRAWRANDISVHETDIRLPGEGLLILAAKAVDVGGRRWEYEYALQNVNSTCAGRSFSIPIPAGAVVDNIGFHDVDYHSGEPFDGTDWTVTVTGGAITWSTVSADVDSNANALRWGSLYNFRFQATVPPSTTNATFGTFKPGCVPFVLVETVGPSLTTLDCNDNGIPDACDLACGAVGCGPDCGLSLDCNDNGLPDECEPDCNLNGFPDSCDLATGRSNDCNGNFVPDDCEPDCDGDGLPDVCDVPQDSDQDGVDDCFDLCPFTSPVDACRCPPMGCPGCTACCFFPNNPTQCFTFFTRGQCLASGGTPECLEGSVCRDGCLFGDSDLDGDLDMKDVNALFVCFSGSPNSGWTMPSAECLLRFDFDDDNDVDMNDYQAWLQAANPAP